MKSKKIIQFGHKTLRQQSSLVPEEYLHSKEIVDLINDLQASLPEHGIGLAAPQINQPWRVFLADVYRVDWSEDSSTRPIVCINPEIISSSSTTDVDWEGCLSAPGIWGQVTRPDKVVVSFINQAGDRIEASLSGVGARVFQHELDHLNGILFVDRMADMTTLITDEEFEKIRESESKIVE